MRPKKTAQDSWQRATLGQVCRPTQWPTIPSSELLETGYPVYGANGHIGYFSEYNHDRPVIAITCRGATCGEINWVPEKCYVTGNAMCLDDLDENRIASRFLYYYLKLKGVKAIISGSAQPQIIGADIRKVEAEHPTLPEQRKIADILGTWDEALERLDALIAAKDRSKQALMQQLLTGVGRLRGARAWKQVCLSDVAVESTLRNGEKLDRGRLYAVTKAEGMVPMRAHVQGATIDRCKIVDRGWFAYNPMRINIGSIARWEAAKPVMVSPDYVVFRTDEKRLLSDYLNHLRRASPWADFVAAAGNGSVRVRIWFDDLGRFRFPLPSIQEQRTIATILDTADAELRLLRQQRAALDQQKRGLMQLLLTGQKRVRV